MSLDVHGGLYSDWDDTNNVRLNCQWTSMAGCVATGLTLTRIMSLNMLDWFLQ